MHAGPFSLMHSSVFNPTTVKLLLSFLNSSLLCFDLLLFFQGLQMGIVLPQFLLNFDGTSGGVLLLGIVGVCILLPLMIAVIYLLRSSNILEIMSCIKLYPRIVGS